ncbi:YdcF family protein [Desmospora profundinema]|uniref:Uncharacterized SAM-binding protein YcdF (DUF218 family) n=1 Tax=Desmospora profundinema TaxID=1571184 RepID=A0ABU1IN19_9BACL|nr:YdcF family protein [Desmospora profundinema]MDR6225952.1 uncharacterized SAM-binding protein YcdF (DUF218 family) [Desmospora profundinema]
MTGVWMIFLAALFLFLAGFFYCYVRVAGFREQPVPGPPREAAIVLGAALHGNKPSPALRERLDYALTLYRDGRFSLFVCCGGFLRRQVSEAAVMRNYLLERGVPPTAVLLEDASANTAQNLAFARPILEGQRIDTCLLITHEYHMYRACLHAKRYGIDATPAPCSTRHLWVPYHRTRECFALMRWFLLRL